MTKNPYRPWSVAVLCALAAAAASAFTEVKAQAITLVLSHYLPANHPIQTDMLSPWARSIEKCAGGGLKIEIKAADSPLGSTAKQLDQVRSGTTDIAHGLSALPPGRLPRTTIIDMPFMTKSASAASRALWESYQTGLISEEYRGLKVLALHAHNPGQIHLVSKEVKSLNDLKGLRIRYPSKAVQFLLEHLGAQAVGMPPTDVLPSLKSGLIDGTAFPWEAVNGFKLYDDLYTHLDGGIYTTSFFFVMNQLRFAALPDKARQCIDKNSGAPLVERIGKLWNKWDQPGRARVRNHNIRTLTEAERTQWLTQFAPVEEKYLQFLESQGVAEPRKLYEAVKKLVARYE